MNNTLVEIFRQSVRQYANRPMLYEKRDGEYRPTSYRSGFEIVAETAAGLIDLGMQSADRCLLFSEGRSDWLLSELGILYAGGIVVPLSEHCENSAEIRYRCSQAGIRYAIVSENLLFKILPIKKNLPKLKKVIVLKQAKQVDEDIILMSELRKNGKQFLKKYPDRFEETWQSVRGDAPATISYSSGSSDRARGVVLTHKNYLANLEQIKEKQQVSPQHVIGLLPSWEHPIVHTCGLYTAIASGASFASVNLDSSNLTEDLKSLKPHVLITTPLEIQELKNFIDAKIKSKRSAWQKRFEKALQTVSSYQGTGYQNGRWNGQPLLKSIMPLIEKLVFTPIHQLFGGRLQFLICGGAHLEITTQKFFTAVGLPVYPGYGLTEAAPVVATTSFENIKFGSVGHVIPGLNIKICHQGQTITGPKQAGEIFIKGPNVAQGVWDSQKVVSSLLKDEWLATGDIGYFDSEDNLFILGRTANQLQSETGTFYSPEILEATLEASCPFIRHILLYNQNRHYTTALIVPDETNIFDWLENVNLDQKTEKGQTAVLEALQNSINQAIKESSDVIPNQWIPKTWALIGESFNFENGFLNSASKIVRSKVFEEYIDRIDTLYTNEGENPVNALNKKMIERMIG